jgi:hypothetical protein
MASNTDRTPPADPWRIDLTYRHRQRWWFSGDTEPEAWQVSADVFDDSGTHRIFHVGDMEIVVIDPDQTTDPFGMLDGEDADLGRIAETVFDPATGQLAPALDDQLEPHGSRILILVSVRLGPKWRGFGLGVLLAGTAIKKLSGGVRTAVCQPAPLRDPQEGDVDQDLVEREVAIACLSKVWSQLGLEHFRDGVHILDLNLVTLDERLEELRKRAETYHVLDER